MRSRSRLRGDPLVNLMEDTERLRKELGVSQRHIPRRMLPFGFNGSDVFDETDTMDVLAFVPSEVEATVRVKVAIHFREFFAPAMAAVAAGELTTPAGGGGTSEAGGSHGHMMFEFGGAGSTQQVAFLARTAAGGDHSCTILANALQDLYTREAADAHDHPTPDHQHTVEEHGHGLVYGVFKEPFPESHDVTLGIYHWDGSSWALIVSISGLTDRVEELDVKQYVTGSGLWRFSLQSAPGQPNGGRLGCDLAGFLMGGARSA